MICKVQVNLENLACDKTTFFWLLMGLIVKLLNPFHPLSKLVWHNTKLDSFNGPIVFRVVNFLSILQLTL